MNEDDSSDDDYEDSDSNAEDYYQNDYPEDELSDNAHPCEFFLSAVGFHIVQEPMRTIWTDFCSSLFVWIDELSSDDDEDYMF